MLPAPRAAMAACEVLDDREAGHTRYFGRFQSRSDLSWLAEITVRPSRGTASYLAPAIRGYTSVEPLGWLPYKPEWEVRERHLGLTTVEDDLSQQAGRWQALGRSFGETVDLDRLLEISRQCGAPESSDAQVIVPAPSKPVQAAPI